MNKQEEDETPHFGNNFYNGEIKVKTAQQLENKIVDVVEEEKKKEEEPQTSLAKTGCKFKSDDSLNVNSASANA